MFGNKQRVVKLHMLSSELLDGCNQFDFELFVEIYPLARRLKILRKASVKRCLSQRVMVRLDERIFVNTGRERNTSLV